MLLVDIWEFAKSRDRYFWYKMPQDIKDFGVENVTSPSPSYPPSNVTSPIFSNPNSSYRYFQIQRFACSICDKVFYRCSYCERHITTAHSDFWFKISSYSLILAKTNHRHTCTTYSLQIVKRAIGKGKEALLFEALQQQKQILQSCPKVSSIRPWEHKPGGHQEKGKIHWTPWPEETDIQLLRKIGHSIPRKILHPWVWIWTSQIPRKFRPPLQLNHQSPWIM